MLEIIIPAIALLGFLSIGAVLLILIWVVINIAF